MIPPSQEIIVPIITPSSKGELSRLFPGVKPPPSPLAPRRVPTSGPEATAALLNVLRDNHERNHVVFNEFNFHNHSVHHIGAIYALGAPAPVISTAYQDTHLDHLRAAFVAPERVTITDDNFTDYLGDNRYYNAYLYYFRRAVLEPGATISNLLEKYLFSPHYNIRTPQHGAEQPQMLNRLFEQLFHPLIQLGYGAEFGMPVSSRKVHGLAWTSVHVPGTTTLITRLLFTPTRMTPINDVERQEPEWMPKPGSRLRALNVLSLMLRDPRFESRMLDINDEFGAMLKSHGEVINKYGEMWDCQIESEGDLEERVEELIWVATLMYGVGSWDGNEVKYRADFFTAHFVTSVLFIPSICAYLPRPSQTKLLRAHFLTSITWWLVRGRSSFAVKAFTSHPLPPLPNVPSSKYSNTFPGPQPTPSACVFPSPTSPFAINPNPWYPILAGVIVHPNEHLCKVQRALSHFSALYGHREVGFMLESLSKDGVEVDPEYAYLDGSVFLRVAWLTGSALGWVSRGEDNSRIWNYADFQSEAREKVKLQLLRSNL